MRTSRTGLNRLQTIGLVTGSALVGAVLVGATAANAASSSPTPSTSTGTSTGSSSSTTAPPQGGRSFSPGGSTPVRSDEKSVSAADSATLSAAALKAVPGATVIRVETDAGDAAYEAHLTKSDGTLATVKFDKNLAVVTVETGMGQGDPAPAGAPGSAPAGAAPSSTSSTTA